SKPLAMNMNQQARVAVNTLTISNTYLTPKV
ncbi:MAG: hypothetical protein ACI8Z5_002396, partial [Lentimonas sp.]